MPDTSTTLASAVQTAPVANSSGQAMLRPAEDAIAAINHALDALTWDRMEQQLRSAPVFVCDAMEAEWVAFTDLDGYRLRSNFMVWHNGKVLIVELPLAPQQQLVQAVSMELRDDEQVREYLCNHGASHTTDQRREADASFGPIRDMVRPLGARLPAGLAK